MKNKIPIKILFVCTANLSRSITAEFCLKDYLKKNHISHIEVASAGVNITIDSDNYDVSHLKKMEEMGIDTSSFHRTQLNADMLNEYDLVVGMGTSHTDYIKEQYGRVVPTFNEVYKGEKTSLTFDINGKTDLSTQLEQMVEYINNAMPDFVENLNFFLNKEI